MRNLTPAFYKEWIKPQGYDDAITYVMVLQTGQRIGLLVAQSHRRIPALRREVQIRLFGLLFPHICRTVSISDALNLKTIRSEALEATLNALSSGCLSH